MSAYRFRNRLPVAGEGKAPRAELDASRDSSGILTLWLYDVIDSWGGYWGISADEVRQALAQFNPAQISEVHVHVNSPGGEVWEAAAINNILAAFPAPVKVMVDGLAASAASLIAARADELVMGLGSELMIHDVWTLAIGNAAALRTAADLSDNLSADIASQYAAKGGGTAKEWRDLMLAETWFNAQEAVDSGLADRVGTLTESNAVQSVAEGDDDSAEDMLFAASIAGVTSSPRAAAALARAARPVAAVPPVTGPTPPPPVASAETEDDTTDAEAEYEFRARVALRG